MATEADVMNPGVNVRPGSEDDGWAEPPGVGLGDGTVVQLFKDGQALSAAYEAIESARRSVCLEVYIFSGDETGRRFAELLMRKAREGVAVFLIYDDFGSIGTPREMFAEMTRAGVRVRVFHPLRPWECLFSWRPFNRDHRKLLVIDGERGGLGGLNVAAEYAGSWVVRRLWTRDEEHQFWRDNAVGVVGPSVAVLQEAFNRTWKYLGSGGRIKRTLMLHPEPVGDARNFRFHLAGEHFSLMATVPTMDSPLRPTLHRLFGLARRSIHLTMAYFAPDDPLVEGLCAAARRGVRVRLMLPGRCDVPILVTAARSFYHLLMSAGVEVYERQAVVLHAKTMVVDEIFSVVGSTNLDYRSIEYNLEISAIITSGEFGRQMVELFENDVKYAVRIDPAAWNRRGWSDRVEQWAVSRARYAL